MLKGNEMLPFYKDPNETLDYQIDWTARLNTDKISSSTWIVPAGIQKTAETHIDTGTSVWLAGGTTGESYTLVNRVNTLGGRIMDQSIKIKIKER